jgi:hypothetical protein
MDDFFSFIYNQKKDKHIHEQISLYIEDILPEYIQNNKEETEEKVIIIDIL